MEVPHTSPTRQRGSEGNSLAGASGWCSICLARVVQSVATGDLKSLQCGFESHHGHDALCRMAFTKRKPGSRAHGPGADVVVNACQMLRPAQQPMNQKPA